MVIEDKKQTNLQKIQYLREYKRVQKRKPLSTIAKILNIKYNSTKQKIDEKKVF